MTPGAVDFSGHSERCAYQEASGLFACAPECPRMDEQQSGAPGEVEAWLTLHETGGGTALVEFWRADLYAFVEQHDAADRKAAEASAARIAELELALREIMHIYRHEDDDRLAAWRMNGVAADALHQKEAQ
jgi:hypothetical protein